MNKVSNQFLGLSTDTKPSAGVRVGTEFVEQDTGATYVWSGSVWLPSWGSLGKTGKIGKTGPTGPTGATGPTGPSAL